MNHAEIVTRVRELVKVCNIKARVRKQVVCGHQVVQVFVAKHGQEFTVQEQVCIKAIGLWLDLTFVRGLAIDLERHTNPFDFNFYISAK